MKILILSDSHGVKKYMDKIVPIIEKDIDLIIHAGDNFRDSIYLKERTEKPVIAVAGNCDFENVERDIDFEVEGVKMFLTHGHKYGVKYGLGNLADIAHEKSAKIAIFGHTHVKEDRMLMGVQMINPGSLSLPRDGIDRSYVIMDIEDGSFTYEYRFL